MAYPKVIFRPSYPIVAGQAIKLSDLISFDFTNSPEVASYSLRFDVYSNSGYTITGGYSQAVAGGPNGTTGLQFEAHVYGTQSGYYPQSTEFNSLSITFNSLSDTTIKRIYDGIIYINSGHNYAYDASNYVGNDTILIPTPLYTTAGNDTINFNNLTSTQVYAVKSGADLYHTGSGNDVITLPSSARSVSVGNSGIAYNLSTPLTLGNGNDTVYGTDGVTNIALGGGLDTVYLNGSQTTLKLGSGIAVVNFTTASQTVSLVTPSSGLMPTIYVSGFSAGDVIDFSGQPGLTLAANWNGLLLNNEVDVYAKTKQVARLFFGSDVSRLEPVDGVGGTKIVTDTTVLPLVDPDAGAVDWAHIHLNESSYGQIVSPYVPLGITLYKGNRKSGVTIGYGVDLTAGHLNTPNGFQAAISPAYPNWPNDPNLAFLFGAVGVSASGIGDSNSEAADRYLQANGSVGADSRGKGNLYSSSVTITESQANVLTQYDETLTYNQLKADFEVQAGAGTFSSLPGGIKTVLLDLGYNWGLTDPGGSTKPGDNGLENKTVWRAIKAYALATTPTDQQAALKKADRGLTNLPQNLNPARARSDADKYIVPLITSPVAATVEQTGITIGTTLAWNFTVTDATTQYLLDPDGSSTYMLVATDGSPAFASVILPVDGASSFSVTTEAGTTWLPSQVYAPDSVIVLPDGTNGIAVTLLDDAGMPQVGEFSYLVTFASAGTFSGSVTGSTACYAKGTRLLSVDGYRDIESLSAGDMLMTTLGQLRPIIWIGHRSYGGRFLAANSNMQPIHFHAGSLGDGLPRRDLFVSPEHAMFLDDVLVPAKLLVNGETIVQETDLAIVEYFHVELDSHDIILAEGAPSESFVDCDSRSMFQNAHTFTGTAPRWEFCAPRVEDGPALARICDRLRPRGPARASSATRGHLARAPHAGTGWAGPPENPDAALEAA